MVVRRRRAHVADVARHDAFTGHSWDQPVEEQQHSGVVMHDLGNESLTLLDLDQGFDREVDVLSIADIV